MLGLLPDLAAQWLRMHRCVLRLSHRVDGIARAGGTDGVDHVDPPVEARTAQAAEPAVGEAPGHDARRKDFVLEGELRVRQMIGGKETVLVTLLAGEFFGDISLFDHGPRSADVVANNNSVLLKVSAANLQRMVQDAPELATPFLIAICKTLTARIRADNKRLRDSINVARASR